MKCPACGTPLEEERTSSYRIFQCPKCKGGWFDPGELVSCVKVMDAGKAPLYLDFSSRLNTSTYPRERPGPEKRPCPRCNKASLEETNYAYNSNVMVDKCPACEGVWLDGGEFPMVAQFLSGSEIFRERAATMAEKAVASQSIPGGLSVWLAGAAAIIYIICAMLYLGGLAGFAEGAVRMGFSLAFIWGAAFMTDNEQAVSFASKGAACRLHNLHGHIIQFAGWVLMAYSGWRLWWAWKNGMYYLGRF